MRPSDIIYSKAQIEDFILPNLFTLREGVWAGEIEETDHYNHGAPYTATFVLAAEVAAEVDARLCKVPSKISTMLIKVYTIGYTVGEHAKQTNQDEEWLDRERRWAIRYISGNRRKLSDYSVWKAGYKRDQSHRRICDLPRVCQGTS